MEIRFLGAESLGVRSLSLFIDLGARKIVIDPGVALGFYRRGLHPHPLQAVFSEIAKVRIVKALRSASDVVVTHLHGDHVPLYRANPFQLPLDVVRMVVQRKVFLWMKRFEDMSSLELARARHLIDCLGDRLVLRQGSHDDCVELLGPYSHGLEKSRVVGVVARLGSRTLVHLSDTQLLVDDVVKDVREHDPWILIVSGPPLYRYHGASRERLAEIARLNLAKLCSYADYVIVDHHLLRSVDGSMWLDEVRKEVGDRVMCVADFIGSPRLLLEAWREVLYETIPTNRRWFLEQSYTGCGEAIATYREIVEELVKNLPRETTVELDEVRRHLRELSTQFLDKDMDRRT